MIREVGVLFMQGFMKVAHHKQYFVHVICERAQKEDSRTLQ